MLAELRVRDLAVIADVTLPLAPGLNVFWAGDNKVVIGETALRPKFAADWERLQ